MNSRMMNTPYIVEQTQVCQPIYGIRPPRRTWYTGKEMWSIEPDTLLEESPLRTRNSMPFVLPSWRLAAVPMSTTLHCSQTWSPLRGEPWTHLYTQVRDTPWLCVALLNNGLPMAAVASPLSWSTLVLNGDRIMRHTNLFVAYHLSAADTWQHLSIAFIRRLQLPVWTHGLPCSRMRNTGATTSCCSRTSTEVSYSRPMPRAGLG